MFAMRFDANSPYSLRWPRSSRPNQVLALARAFVAQEESLPAAQQSPFLADVSQLLEQAEPIMTQQVSGEAAAASASEKIKRLDEEAKEIARQVKALFTIVLADKPEEAKKWGLNVSPETNNILLPRNREERLAFLKNYVAAEDNRPEGERFPLIDLAHVRQVRDRFSASLTTRNTGGTKGVAGTTPKGELSQKLLATLQVAGAYLLAKRFDFKLTPELAKWGYKVLERSSQKANQSEAE